MNTIYWVIKKCNCMKSICLTIFFKLLQVVVSIAFAISMMNTIDIALANNSLFKQQAMWLVLLVILSISLKAISYYVENRNEVMIEAKLKDLLFASIITQDYRSISKYHSGELMNRYANDVVSIANGISKQIPNMIAMIVRILAVFVVIFVIEPFLAIILILGGICLVIAAFVLKRILKRYQEAAMKEDDKVKGYVQECLESLLVIHSFNKEEAIINIQQAKMDKLVKIMMKKINVVNLFDSGLNLAIQAAYVIGFLYSVYSVMNHQMSVGGISAMIQLIGQIQSPFVSLGLSIPQLVVYSYSVKRIKDLIVEQKIEPKIQVNYEDIESIIFEDVCFAYDQKLVIDHFNLEVKKDNMVALVGYSGVGKSTLMKLLLNLYTLNSGRIYLKTKHGEYDVKDVAQGLFAYVPQDYGLMSGKIKEVVAFGIPSDKIDEARVKWACHMACIDDFIEGLDDQYDTLLKEKGSGISGGQMQRIAIARALYSDCKILILDEASASLNNELEQKLLMNLKSLNDYTMFVVSHRESILALANQVVTQKEVI